VLALTLRCELGAGEREASVTLGARIWDSMKTVKTHDLIPCSRRRRQRHCLSKYSIKVWSNISVHKESEFTVTQQTNDLGGLLIFKHLPSGLKNIVFFIILPSLTAHLNRNVLKLDLKPNPYSISSCWFHHITAI